MLSRKTFLNQISLAASGMLLVPGFARGGDLRKFNAIYGEGIAPFLIEGDKLIVPKATYSTPDRQVVVHSRYEFEVPPADIVKVEREAIRLSKNKPSGYYTGTMLAGTKTSSIGAFHSLIAESLVIKDSRENVLQIGKDYLVSSPYALVGIGPDASVTPETPVYASYSFWHQRIDTVVAGPDGKVSYIKGLSKLVSPALPVIPEGYVALCNVYRPFMAASLSPLHIFPIVATSGRSSSVNARRIRIPDTIKKLKAGKEVKIVTWGDSIAAAGDVKPELSWPRQFAQRIKEKYPQANARFKNLAIGGSKSAQWLNNGSYPGLRDIDPAKCRFDLVLREKPDLVVMEFLNDIVFTESELHDIYGKIKKSFDRINTEWIIVTPSYLIPNDYNLAKMRDERPRLLDSFLREFADKNGCGLADPAARWKRLYKEGIPYFSVFNNGFNHPNE